LPLRRIGDARAPHRPSRQRTPRRASGRRAALYAAIEAALDATPQAADANLR
jgi:hypothetical protein